MVSSTFNKRNLGILLFSLFLLIVLLLMILLPGTGLPVVFNIVFSALLLLMLAWLLFAELGKKAVKITIQADTILVSGLLGLGHPRLYEIKSFDGYKIVMLPSEDYQLEFLHPLRGGKKIITLSEFYHSNYDEW